MATHGYIKIDRGSKDKSTMIHAFHDGYLGPMMQDVFSIPLFIFDYLKTAGEKGGRNSYKYEMFTRDKDWKDFESFVGMWNSLIPLDSIEYTFESFMVTQDPLMYGIDHSCGDSSDITIKFSKGRLPSCIIKVENRYDEDEEYIKDIIENIDEYLQKINDKIYFEENKIKKLPDGTYYMEVDKIVCDLFWQETNISVKRDMKLNEII